MQVMSLLFWGFANDTTSLTDATLLYPLFGIGANVAQTMAGKVVFPSHLIGIVFVGLVFFPWMSWCCRLLNRPGAWDLTSTEISVGFKIFPYCCWPELCLSECVGAERVLAVSAYAALICSPTADSYEHCDELWGCHSDPACLDL